MSLVHENNQLQEHWRGVGTMQLAMCLDHIENNVIRNRPDLVNHYVRQFHNVLGYRAMGELRDGGLCAGALYRSDEFVSIPQDSRNGSARVGNVHIEHTVPVNVLVSAIFSRYSTQRFVKQSNATVQSGCSDWLASPLYDFLLTYSVTTALTREQGRVEPTGIVKLGLAHAVNTPLEMNGLPFRRYLSEATIFSVSGGTGPGVAEGQRIAMDQYTFECHRKRLVSLMNDVNRTDLLPPNWPQ